MLKLFLLLLFHVLVQAVGAQYQIGLVPRVSPNRTTSLKVGYTDVRVTYGSPSVNDRVLWGELVPYGEVWRAGANAATTVSWSTPVQINGHRLDSGTYAFFLIPDSAQTWTAIFNRTAQQWGAFRYQESEDALRVPVAAVTVPQDEEHLTYSLGQQGFQAGTLTLNWGRTEVSLPFSTQYLDLFVAEVNRRAEQQPEYIRWVVLLQGAEHLAQTGLDAAQALRWIDLAEEGMAKTTTWNEQFYPRSYVEGHVLWTKAKLLAKAGDLDQAIAYATRLKNLGNAEFYQRKNVAESIDELLNLWRRP